MSFFELTIRKGREPFLVDIADEFNLQYNEHFNIALVKVTSATALDQTTTDQILSKVKKLIGTDKTIQLDTHIDAAIIGGFIIQFGDNLYDSSVVYQLAKLKQSFSHNS